jgi:putative flippase GtrA
MATRLNVRNETFGQLVRFAIVGFSLAALYSAIYWYLATFVMAPMLAVVVAFSVAVTLGFVLHSRWSFRGHGRRDNLARTGSRFLIVSLISLGLNSLWVWLMTEPLALSPAWPILPMLFVTPLVTFTLNRQWVFA